MTTSTNPPRATMNGKPVIEVAAKTVLNLKSGFAEKLLCDGPTFSAGTACVYRCSFCYVPSQMAKSPHLKGIELPHSDVVIRRANAIELLRAQLVDAKGRARFRRTEDAGRVVYASPLVDVAANMDLVRETVAMCELILEHTDWDIRLLSKSNLLPQIALLLDRNDTYPFATPARRRVIYGLSTGTLDDGLAAAFEQDCPRVSKRLTALHWLQDNGFRTFGMLCPSLPTDNYEEQAAAMHAAIQANRCEHVWAEVLNVRGDSMERTCSALEAAGFRGEAAEVRRVSSSPALWEEYARATFLAHVRAGYRPGQLRFLQYVNPRNRDWWRLQESSGAVLLGVAAHDQPNQP